MWRGGLGSAYLLPALSSAGASLSGPCSVSTSRSSNRTCLSQASGSRRRLTQLPKAIACDAVCDSRKQLGSLQAHRQSPFLRRFLRPPSTRAPSRPGELHPEPLTEPDVNLSIHPARATQRRLSPSIKTRS